MNSILSLGTPKTNKVLTSCKVLFATFQVLQLAGQHLWLSCASSAVSMGYTWKTNRSYNESCAKKYSEKCLRTSHHTSRSPQAGPISSRTTLIRDRKWKTLACPRRYVSDVKRPANAGPLPKYGQWGLIADQQEKDSIRKIRI